MKVYEAVEYITEDFLTDGSGENASGMFSTADKARTAIIARIAEEYTLDEINEMDIPETDWEYLEVPENEYTSSCTYVIYEYELDGRIE